MHRSYASIMADNPLKLRQIHHVEFWVGNAKQAAFFYRKAFGFSEFAYSGLETGQRTMTSYALKQGRARFVFATPLSPAHPAADHLRAHGDGMCSGMRRDLHAAVRIAGRENSGFDACRNPGLQL